jgi:hypothetical protein
MITPAGAPAWVKTNDHTTYGGDVNKQNYQSRGAVNPLTDVTAAQFCRLAADIAALQLVAEFATITYQCNDSVPGAPTILYYDGMVGTLPTPTRNGNGDVTWVWSATYNDDYGITGALNIAHAMTTLQGSTAGSAPYQRVNGQTIRVTAANGAGAGMVDPVVTLTVYPG